MKTGALIAFAAGSLFATACEKQEGEAAKTEPAKAEPTKTEPTKTEPTKTEPTVTPEADKPDPAAVNKADPAAGLAEKTAKVDCAGVNACKGQGTCKTEKHGCGGQNACKGQGVLAMTEGECEQQGGTIAARH